MNEDSLPAETTGQARVTPCCTGISWLSPSSEVRLSLSKITTWDTRMCSHSSQSAVCNSSLNACGLGVSGRGSSTWVESDEGRDSLHTVVGEPSFLLGADLLLWLSPMLLPIAPYPQLLRKPNKLTSPLMNFGGIVSWFVIRTLGGGGH